VKRIHFNRGVNEELFYHWLGKCYEDLNLVYENDTFMIRRYDYREDDEVGTNEYHFYHKPSGLKIYWYKYPFRASASNMDITYDQFREVLIDCRNSLEERIVYDIISGPYWWENKI
jgi:hypothetical protein